MRRRSTTTRATTLAAAAAAVLAVGLAAPTAASTAASTATAARAADPVSPADVSPYLATTLPGLTGKSTVLVHGFDLAADRAAVSAAGLSRVGSFDRIGVVAARGTKAQIQDVRSRPGVEYVEAGEQPIRFFDDTSHTATRGTEAQ